MMDVPLRVSGCSGGTFLDLQWIKRFPDLRLVTKSTELSSFTVSYYFLYIAVAK